MLPPRSLHVHTHECMSLYVCRSICKYVCVCVHMCEGMHAYVCARVLRPEVCFLGQFVTGLNKSQVD